MDRLTPSCQQAEELATSIFRIEDNYVQEYMASQVRRNILNLHCCEMFKYDSNSGLLDYGVILRVVTQHFEETHCLRQDKSVLKLEAASSSNMSVITYKITRCSKPDDHNLAIRDKHCCETKKSKVTGISFSYMHLPIICRSQEITGEIYVMFVFLNVLYMTVFVVYIMTFK
jgi:hypothetical protein